MNQLARLPIAQEEPARFTAEEFMAIATASPLRDHPGRIDLVEGIIVRMAPPNYPHSDMQNSVFVKLHDLLRAGTDNISAKFEVAIKLDPHTVRTPDAVVLRDPGTITGIVDSGMVLLAVEVADTSLREDLEAKRVSYAEAGIPHYWVVDINAKQVHVFGDLADGDYQSRHRVPFGQPLPVPGADGAITLDG